MIPPQQPLSEQGVLASVQQALKLTLFLFGVLAFLIIMFATDWARFIGGTPKQEALAIMLIVAIPLAVAYYPLKWIAGRYVKRRIAARSS